MLDAYSRTSCWPGPYGPGPYGPRPSWAAWYTVFAMGGCTHNVRLYSLHNSLCRGQKLEGARGGCPLPHAHSASRAKNLTIDYARTMRPLCARSGIIFRKFLAGWLACWLGAGWLAGCWLGGWVDRLKSIKINGHQLKSIKLD